METHILLAYTECVPGTDEAFNAWYDAVHVHDVLKVPGLRQRPPLRGGAGHAG